MRLLAVLIALAPLGAAAQNDWSKYEVADLETGDLEDADRPDPRAFISAIGQRWANVQDALPDADSTALEGDTGFVRWTSVGDEVAALDLSVLEGLVVQLTFHPTESVPQTELASFAQELAQAAGPAAPNGFHDASEWSDTLEVASGLARSGIKIQVGMFLEERVLIVRITPGSLP